MPTGDTLTTLDMLQKGADLWSGLSPQIALYSIDAGLPCVLGLGE